MLHFCKMLENKVYILHKNGANSHYIGLNHLLNKNDASLLYREFSVFSKLFKGITNGNFALVKKQFTNLGFFMSLLFSKNKKIILGIAPYDAKLKTLVFFLKNHKVYYHTSWTCWDKTFQPKKIKKQSLLTVWRYFLEEKATHIFAVSNTTKKNLLKNYALNDAKVSVVYHSIDDAFLSKKSIQKNKNSFVYYGRLVPQKGIDQLLSVFKKQAHATITFIGSGSEQAKIKTAATQYPNISWLPFASDKTTLVKMLHPFEYLVVNSIKTSKWEELFGMAIIESMALGIIPIATNHSGPKEIIDPQIGYLCDEGKMGKLLQDIITSSNKTDVLSKRGIEKSKEFSKVNISKHWKAIL